MLREARGDGSPSESEEGQEAATQQKHAGSAVDGSVAERSYNEALLTPPTPPREKGRRYDTSLSPVQLTCVLQAQRYPKSF